MGEGAFGGRKRGAFWEEAGNKDQTSIRVGEDDIRENLKTLTASPKYCQNFSNDCCDTTSLDPKNFS